MKIKTFLTTFLFLTIIFFSNAQAAVQSNQTYIPVSTYYNKYINCGNVGVTPGYTNCIGDFHPGSKLYSIGYSECLSYANVTSGNCMQPIPHIAFSEDKEALLLKEKINEDLK
jgi:hypothetical protein